MACNFVTIIEDTECIGASLVKINNNFTNLQTGLCNVINTPFSVVDSTTIDLFYNTTQRSLSGIVRPDSIDTVHLKSGSVTGDRIATGTITTDKFATGINGSLITNNTIGTLQLVNNSVTQDILQNNIITDIKVASNAAIAGSKIVPSFGTQTVEARRFIPTGGGPTPSIGLYSPTTNDLRLTVNTTDAVIIRQQSGSNDLTVNNGTISINTFTPAGRLHVFDNLPNNIGILSVKETDTGAPLKLIQSVNSALPSNFIIQKTRGSFLAQSAVQTGDGVGNIRFTVHDGSLTQKDIATIRGYVETFNQTNNVSGNLRFYTRSVGVNSSESADVERMRITSSGNIGINTTSPQEKLDIFGNIRFGDSATNRITLQYSGTASQTIIIPDPGATGANLVLSVGDQNISGNKVFLQGTQINMLGVGTPATGPTGQIRATSDVIAFFGSDKRLKENIQPISNALEKVLKISGIEFDWSDEYIKRNGGEDGFFIKKHDVGVVAQEIQEVLPEIVAERNDGYLAVKYDRLCVLLIEAIKDLSSQITELKNKHG